MIETILSVIVAAGFLAASFILGYSVGNLSKRTNVIKLEDGSEIHMWKGFVDRSKTFVAHFENDKSSDGDGVIFDEKGNIIHVDHVEKE